MSLFRHLTRVANFLMGAPSLNTKGQVLEYIKAHRHSNPRGMLAATESFKVLAPDHRDNVEASLREKFDIWHAAVRELGKQLPAIPHETLVEEMQTFISIMPSVSSITEAAKCIVMPQPGMEMSDEDAKLFDYMMANGVIQDDMPAGIREQMEYWLTAWRSVRNRTVAPTTTPERRAPKNVYQEHKQWGMF